MSITATDVAAAIRSFRFRYVDEDQLQEGLAGALARRGFDVQREVRLDARNRIDLMVGRVGIEVKVAGKASDVLRQCTRYLALDALDELVLVSSRVRHMHPPQTLAGKPFHVVSLTGAGL